MFHLFKIVFTYVFNDCVQSELVLFDIRRPIKTKKVSKSFIPKWCCTMIDGTL